MTSQIVRIEEEGQPDRIALINDRGEEYTINPVIQAHVQDAVTLDNSMREAIERLNRLQARKDKRK